MTVQIISVTCCKIKKYLKVKACPKREGGQALYKENDIAKTMTSTKVW